MSNLQAQLQSIAAEFVSSILGALKSASLADVAGQVGAAKAPAAKAAPSKRPGRAAKAVPVASAPAKAAAVPAKKPAKAGKRHRASAAEVQAMKNTALATAKLLQPGFSKGDVMKKSGSKVDLGRALTLLVEEGKLTKKGDRRLTRYTVK